MLTTCNHDSVAFYWEFLESRMFSIAHDYTFRFRQRAPSLRMKTTACVWARRWRCGSTRSRTCGSDAQTQFRQRSRRSSFFSSSTQDGSRLNTDRAFFRQNYWTTVYNSISENPVGYCSNGLNLKYFDYHSWTHLNTIEHVKYSSLRGYWDLL